MPVSMFCAVGKHGGPQVSDGGPGGGKIGAHPDWRLLPAKLAEDGEWVYDKDSKASIYVCPKCALRGEPAAN